MKEEPPHKYGELEYTFEVYQPWAEEETAIHSSSRYTGINVDSARCSRAGILSGVVGTGQGKGVYDLPWEIPSPTATPFNGGNFSIWNYNVQSSGRSGVVQHC